MNKVFLLLIALFVITSKSAFSQQLTCPANPQQLATNIANQERQNAFADSLGWPLFERSSDIGQYLTSGYLVPVSTSGVGYRLRKNSFSSNVLKPHARMFLEWFSEEFTQAFPGEKAEWTTLTRTLERHRALQRIARGRNAASCITKYRCTSHAYGMSLDLTYLYMSTAELAWTLSVLELSQARGEVIFHREVCVKNIHIAVLRAPNAQLATHPQTPAEEDDMSRGTQPATVRDGGGR